MKFDCRMRAGTRFGVVAVLGVVLAGMASVANAQDGETGWLPPSPADMPNDFDWVQLPSGEWLGGEVIALYDDSLEFDSDEMGVTTIDWDDVVELRTVQVLEVRPLAGESVIGKVVAKEGKVSIVGETTTTFDQAEVLAITAGVPKERNFWSGEASGSANYQSGNTDKKTFLGRVNVQRRTVEQRLIFDYIGNYDETDGEESENNHRLTGDWDRFVTDRIFWSPIVAEYFKDKFQNIEHRITLGPAVGYELIDTPTTSWRVSGGPGYTKTWFQDVAPGEDDTADSFAFQGKTRFDHELTDDIDIWYDYRFLVANSDTGGYTHRMETGIAFEIIGDLDIRASYVWDYINEPSEDEDGNEPDKSDTQLLLGLGYSF
jgi:putative salt-induced outer membrane protein YdiY